MIQRQTLLKRNVKIFLVSLAIVAVIAAALFNSWHKHQLDDFDGWLISLFSIEDTVFASGYSDKAFKKLKVGMNRQEVLNLLGEPLIERWKYKASCECCSSASIWLGKNIVTRFYIDPQDQSKKIRSGIRRDELIKKLGLPIEESWSYTKSPGDHSYSIRAIRFKDDHVIEIFHEFYID